MYPKHSNPTRADRTAHAPYNFVPLPEKVVLARSPVPHNTYRELTGRIRCTLTTASPVYVRGMLTADQYQEFGEKPADKLTEAEKLTRASFYSVDRGEVEGFPVPMIPGSSLRGLVRGLVEIVGFGRMRWVADEPAFYFRAMAAARDDPLKQPYDKMLGRYGSNVRAGYLQQRGDRWIIQPAYTPEEVGLPESSGYLKVKERAINPRTIPGFRCLNDSNYRPGYYHVTFDMDTRQGRRGNRYVAITAIGAPEAGHKYTYHGRLVCSGNMKETNPGGSTPRKNHALVLPANRDARALSIPDVVVRGYLTSLTPYQKENLWAGDRGCLEHEGPVFYITTGDEVVAFGHSPNFRVPAVLPGREKAATPRDHVPEDVTDTGDPDLADAVFGWVEEVGIGPRGHQAGHVTFSDGRYAFAAGRVWLSDRALTPHILSGPKPTTFQHYLVQDADLRHDPDDKVNLAHYGTMERETVIRGHKQYWHRGENPEIEATTDERQHESQLTRIVPLRAGVGFTFDLDFENLHKEELGALLWVLTLPGEDGQAYRHALGMGKPLGMGAVAIEVTDLTLSDRPQRYAELFDGAAWAEGQSAAAPEPYVEAFEAYVLKAIGSDHLRLADLDRIRALLLMLRWPGPDPETTRYMEIEAGYQKVNEYKNRPVLPDPLVVMAGPGTAPKEAQHRREMSETDNSGDSSSEIGIVKFFNDSKGYGFIARDHGEELFVHYSSIAGHGRRSLREGQRVRFEVGQGRNGRPAAVGVVPLN